MTEVQTVLKETRDEQLLSVRQVMKATSDAHNKSMTLQELTTHVHTLSEAAEHLLANEHTHDT